MTERANRDIILVFCTKYILRKSVASLPERLQGRSLKGQKFQSVRRVIRVPYGSNQNFRSNPMRKFIPACGK
jgi:hypothetical protein